MATVQRGDLRSAHPLRDRSDGRIDSAQRQDGAAFGPFDRSSPVATPVHDVSVVASAGRAPGGAELFISYAGPDRPWAEWAAWHLTQAGWSVELDVWDWAAGDNAVLRMNDALASGRRMLALLSPAYFARDRFTLDEWTAIMAERPDGDGRRRLVPVRLGEVEPPPILRPLVWQDLFGVGEAEARERLLRAVGGPRRPVAAPPFPGDAAPSGGAPRLPGALPPVWNLAPRDPHFTGREPLLAELRQRLTGDGRAWVQALHGMGGVGKTQLALEYAHLFAGDYRLAWWVDAERAELVGEQLTALGVAAGWVAADAAAGPAVAEVQQRLRGTAGWLVVLDNASDAASVRQWLPQGPGHVVITSRSAALAEVAAPLEVDVFTRPESVALLRRRLPHISEPDADRMAEALGDLALALTQAAGLMATTRMTADEYLGELATRAAALLAERPPASYPVPLAAAVGASVDRLAGMDAAGVQLLHLCAHLAPEPIRLAWFAASPPALPDPLAAVAADRLAWRGTLGRLADLGLARVTGDALELHRLAQAVLRDLCSPEQRRADRDRAEQLVAAAEPDDDGTDPASWPAWATLLPHVLALDPATAGPDLRSTACEALWYLLMRGDYRAALAHAQRWHHSWRAVHGPADHHTLWAASQLATAFISVGRYGRARELHEDIYGRRRRLDADGPNTLVAANNLANVLSLLGDHQRARELHQDLLTRHRRTVGDDHPDTLTTAHNLANDLRGLGHHQQAHDLSQDTLTRHRRALGDDHPDTLRTAQGLALDLRNLGHYQRAHDLNQDTLARYRRTLGDDHPDTLSTAHNLAADLYALGQAERSRDLSRKALDGLRRMLGVTHPSTVLAARNQVKILRRLGHHDEADEVEAEFGLPNSRPGR
jgi:tetratricopeptide (TPR) repeat protein